MTPNSAAADIVPSLSLLRRPPNKKPSSSAPTTIKKNATKHSQKRPCIPIPSFQAERENLERIFDSGSSSSEESPRQAKKSKKRTRRLCVPIPSFNSLDDDDILEDDEDILNTKPIFSCEARKPPIYSNDEKTVATHEPLGTSYHHPVPIAINTKATTESPALLRANEAHDTSSASDSCVQTVETSNTLHRQDCGQDLSEDDILQLAVGIARSLDPTMFSFKLVQIELEAQTKGAWKCVPLAKLRQFVLQQLEPTEEALHAAIDSVFLSIDIPSSTKKQFIARVQNQFPIPFSQLCRAKITRRLTSLLNKETSPSVVAMANRESIDPNTTASTHEVTKTTIEEHNTMLLGTVSLLDGTNTSMIESSIGNRLPVPSLESNLNTNEGKKPSADKSESTRNPVKERGSKVASNACQTKPTLSKETKPPTRLRKVPKTTNEIVGVIEGISSKTAENSHTETISKKRKAACQLCINCPCSLSIDQPTISICDNHSNPAMERNLIKRLQKLEKIADYYEEQTDSVRRMLKKHRREIWRKREAAGSSKDCSNRPRFLPDAGELGEVMDSIKPRDKMGTTKSRKAQLTVFARAPVVAQATLTQLLGGTNTASKPVLENALEDIIEETEVDLENETLAASDEDDENNEASITSVVREEDGYFHSEPVPFTRVECSNGRECIQSPAKVDGREKSMWISILTRRFSQCLASIIENPDDAEDSSKMDNLFEMIDGDSVPEDVKSTVGPSDAIQLSMLSQRGQTIAQSLINETERDLRRCTGFERQCPQWKENVLFALHQRNSDDIAAALQQLQSEKSILAQKKALVVQAIEEREDMLSLYVKALKMSLSRFSEEEIVDGTNDDYTLCHHEKVKSRPD